MNLIDRVMAKVEMVTESGCWIWTGFCDRDGYLEFLSTVLTSQAGKHLRVASKAVGKSMRKAD